MSPQLFNMADKYFLSPRPVSVRDSAALGSLGVNVSIFDVGPGISSHASSQVKYFSEGILAKFEIFRMAAQYDCVVWFDCDQICLRELSPVLDANAERDFIITDGGEGSKGWGNFIKKTPILNEWLSENPHISFEERGLCGNFFCVFGSGEQAYKRGRDLFFLMESELYGGEQGILYILQQEIFERKANLSHDLFTPHPREWPLDRLLATPDAMRPYFLHAWAQPKFWNGYYHPVWEHWYRVWVALDGTEFVSREPKRWGRLSRIAALFR